MLNPLTPILSQVFLDLPNALRFLFIEWNTDEAIRGGQRTRDQRSVFSLDVKESDLSKIKEALIVVRPVVHTTLIDVVSQVIDDLKPTPLRISIYTLEILKIYVIDRVTLFKSIDEVNQRSTNPLNRR
jgi:hypothetical protein